MYKYLFLASTIVLASLSFSKIAIGAPVTDCDKLAAHADDPLTISEGVLLENIDGPRAVRACKAALKLYPQEGRFHAYLSRAYYKIGDKESALRHSRKSEDLGYLFGYSLRVRQESKLGTAGPL